MYKIIPNLTFNCIDWIEQQDLSQKTLIEFGSGNSTLYFSNKFKKVITFEDEQEWIQKITSLNLPNVEVKFLDYNFYLQDLDLIKNADYVLIDNSPRDNNSRLYVAEALIQKIDYQNTLILDNCNLNSEAYFYLRTKFRHYQDFIGFNRSGNRTVTSVFSERI